MGQHSRHAAFVGVLTAMVLGVTSNAMQPRTAITVSELGPQVGDLVPDFSLPDQTGRVRTRDSILGPNGAILLFHRSADW
jgi:hypothetical protein